jgi:hypothetical protein
VRIILLDQNFKAIVFVEKKATIPRAIREGLRANYFALANV